MRRASPRLARLARLALASGAAFLGGCSATAPRAPVTATTGRATPVAAARTALPEGHPPVPLGQPASNEGHVGRATRRLTTDQLHASLLAATGFTWVAQRRVSDPNSPDGAVTLPDADMIEVLAATLGRPDYLASTTESIDAAITFAKLANDAARSACRASVSADLPAREGRRILHFVGPTDTLASAPDDVRKNLAYLALRFWGRSMRPDDPGLVPLMRLFEVASTAKASQDASGAVRAAATPSDGWRAVCIAMATDPQFLTY